MQFIYLNQEKAVPQQKIFRRFSKKLEEKYNNLVLSYMGIKTILYFGKDNEGGERKLETEIIDIHCRKCNGKMVREKFYDYLDGTGKYCFNGQRCLLCGDIVDPVIMGNRKIKIHEKPRVARKRKFSHV